jgi:DNA-binding transcriptional MerR regulator
VRTKKVVGFSAGNRFALIQFSDGSSVRVRDGDEWPVCEECPPRGRDAEREITNLRTDLAVEEGKVRGLKFSIKDIKRQLEAERVDTDAALKARNQVEAALAETNTALEREREDRAGLASQLYALREEIKQRARDQADLARRYEHLRKYARHWQNCPRIITPNEECSCGFDDAYEPSDPPVEAVVTDVSVPRDVIVMIRDIAKSLCWPSHSQLKTGARHRIIDQCNNLLDEKDS